MCKCEWYGCLIVTEKLRVEVIPNIIQGDGKRQIENNNTIISAVMLLLSCMFMFNSGSQFVIAASSVYALSLC